MKLARIFIGLPLCLSFIVLNGCNSKVHEVKIESVNFDRDVSSIFYAKGDSFDHKYGSATNIPNLILNYENGVHKTIFYGNENLTYSNFQPNTLGTQNINVVYKTSEQQVSIDYQVTVVKGITPEFIEQPRDQETSYPLGVEDGFTAKVKYEDETTYQWESNTVSEEAGDWYPIITTTGKSNHLEIPVTDIQTTYYRCKATSTITGLYTYSEPACLTITNSDQFVNCLYVGENYVLENETLDLSTTPYGNGTISLVKTTETGESGENIKVNTVTFDNVEFNALDPKGGDANFFGISFMPNYICKRKEISRINEEDVWEYEVDEYRFKFKGKNRIINNIWDEDYNSGGYTFCFDFFNYPEVQPGDPEIIRPLVKFLRDDPSSDKDTLYCFGGTNAVYADCRFELDIPTTLESEPNRFSRGITANTFTLKKNCSIKAPCLGGSVISTEYSPDYSYENMGKVFIEENASINAKIRPGAVKNEPTEVYGIKAAMAMETQKGAKIDIDVIVDMNVFDGESSRVISPFAGIHVAYQKGTLEINESDIHIDFSAVNESSSKRSFVTNVNGIASPRTYIIGSDVDIDISSIDFSGVTGILGEIIEIKDQETDYISSDVNINVYASLSVSGIRTALINVDSDGKPQKTLFVLSNSDLKIATDSKYPIAKGRHVGLLLYSPLVSTGETSKVVFHFDDSNDHFADITCNGDSAMPIVYVTNLNVEESPHPYIGYDATFETVAFEDGTAKVNTPSNYNINLDSYEQDEAETFYSDTTFKTHVQHIIIVNNEE